jgi:hypothetical protein
MNVEGLTASNGQCEYTTDGSGNYILSVSREGYVSYIKEFCVSKNSLNDIKVPIIPLVGEESDKANIQLCLSGDAACKGLSFVIQCPLSKNK